MTQRIETLLQIKLKPISHKLHLFVTYHWLVHLRVAQIKDVHSWMPFQYVISTPNEGAQYNTQKQ